MSIGSYLKQVRDDLQLSLRDVERVAKENDFGADVSSGYLSMLERNEVKEPAPRVLFTLAKIYEIDYIDLMKRANYIPDALASDRRSALVAFRGASRLDEGQKKRIQRMIDFELSESKRSKRGRD